MTGEHEVVEGEVADELRHLPAVQQSEAIVARDEISVEEVVAQKDKIVQVMERVMTKEVHYGVIPGTNKPSLLKPGAEAILVALRLAPHYESEKIFTDDGHLTVAVRCELRHITTGLVVATGEGLCSSRESRYAWRKQQRTCPVCGEPQIRRSKYPPKDAPAGTEPGWYCWKKEGGCGENFDAGDTRITDQPEGKVANPDLADTWNTVLKMADKRALVAAVLNGTAASDVFTQDAEDSQAAREQAAAEQRRVDREPVPLPKNWAEMEQRIKAADNSGEAWALFVAFRRAASYHLFGVLITDPDADAGLLKAAQWKTLGQKSAGAVVWLQENVAHEGPFLFYDEDAQRSAWAHVLDGHRLEIPDYVAPFDAEQDGELAEQAREAAEAAD